MLYISQILQYLKTKIRGTKIPKMLYISQILQYLKTKRRVVKKVISCTSLKYYSILKPIEIISYILKCVYK